MNREIKFRGKQVDNGEWVYGYYWRDNSTRKYKITINLQDDNFCCHEVIIDTVGQFTGLTDKKGNEIYEGDMVQHNAWDYPFEVIFHQEKARFVCKMKTGLTQYIDYENIQLVGNIHDNPELIK